MAPVGICGRGVDGGRGVGGCFSCGQAAFACTRGAWLQNAFHAPALDTDALLETPHLTGRVVEAMAAGEE